MKKALGYLAGIIFLLVVFFMISYSAARSKLKRLTPEVRKTLPGKFADLDDGMVNYYWKGPADGQIVVLVHGLSTPKFVWDGHVDALAKVGHRVLVYDHLGRGFSDRPDTRYDRAFYRRELLNLLDVLEIRTPVSLVGYSMGGGNIVGFAAKYPNRVKRLILIAPAGFIPQLDGLAALVLAPGIGEWLMAMFGELWLTASIQKEIKNGTVLPDMMEKFKEQYQYRGYLPAIISTMRHYPMSDLSEEYKAVGQFGIPTFAIWGTNDKIVPFESVKKVKETIPQVIVYPIEGAEHSITYARVTEVNRILIEILQ